MHLRPWLSLPLSALVLLAWPAASYASVGVGIQAGPVALAGDAHPGGRYALPPVYVVNTGTEPESVGIRIERISTGTGRTVPPGWVLAVSAPVRLAHAQSASIPLELSVPQTAARGRYFSDVVATGSSAIADGGASFGVAAATDLEFTVTPGAVSHSWFGVPGWLPPFVLAVLVVTAAAVAFRRSGIRIRVEHGPARMARGRGDDAS